MDIVNLKNGFTRNQINTSNNITNAKTKMTALELKIFYQTVTLIDMKNTEFKEYVISVKDFCEALQLPITNREFLVKTCKKLLRQTFEIDIKDGDYIGYTIFSKIYYNQKEQNINLKFNEEMKPYLLQLKKNFTQIQQVKYIKEFESKYAIRIYALLKDYRLMANRDIKIEALTKMFKLPKSYNNFNNLRKRVLEPAMEEINAKSDLKISSIEPIEKLRKKIITIRINFSNKSEKQAEDFIKHIASIYRLNKKNLDIFLGCYYALEGTKSIKNLLKITKIVVDKNPTYYTVKNGQEIIFATPSLKELENALFKGINNAIIIKAEAEKKQQLNFVEWQNKQDKIEEYKHILEQWQKTGEQLKFYF